MQPALKPAPAPAVNIRLAARADTSLILSFIRELAEYEKLAHEVVATTEILEQNLFGPNAHAECLIAEADGESAGFALFFHSFSTFLGKSGIYLEDLYVRPSVRGAGLGKLLLKELAKIAIERDCGRLEWSVLDWNQPAIDFYHRIGATPLSDWTRNRLDRAAIEKLADAS